MVEGRATLLEGTSPYAQSGHHYFIDQRARGEPFFGGGCPRGRAPGERARVTFVVSLSAGRVAGDLARGLGVAGYGRAGACDPAPRGRDGRRRDRGLCD